MAKCQINEIENPIVADCVCCYAAAVKSRKIILAELKSSEHNNSVSTDTLFIFHHLILFPVLTLNTLAIVVLIELDNLRLKNLFIATSRHQLLPSNEKLR